MLVILLFHLKLILNKVKGATSFEDLKTYNNINYSTYKETAIAMGLIEHDHLIDNIFEEASTIMLPIQLRQFFAWFLLSENIQGDRIWNNYKNIFTEDFNDNKENRALLHINQIFELEDKTCESFNLPMPNKTALSKIYDNEEVLQSKCLFESMYNQLNNDQKNIFETICSQPNKIYFIDGPGGSGKTFLYKTLIYYFISQNKKVVSMAWTGIASILLPKGMTSHRTFRLPLDLTNIKIAFFQIKSDKEKLQEADLIIWDEASMIPKRALEIVDTTLRDICDTNIPFGNKLIVLGGDFRQILPVLKNSSRTNIIAETIKSSYLWPFFCILKLNINMRSLNINFSKLLLEVGEGKIKKFKIPEEWRTNDICSKIFGHRIDFSLNSVILTTHNEYTYFLNNKILHQMEGETKTYYSIDTATYKGVDKSDDNIYINFPIETLNSIREGLPPHELNLKIGAIVMLIRNLSITDGLCNGTRLKVTKLFKYNIEAEIITGDKIGNKVFIPRITLNTGDLSSLPLILYRKQFPLVLAFAMTINKSQGQSFDNVGIYFKKPLFSHGQLYVSLSRCKDPNRLFIQNESENNSEIENIVWNEIFY
jgi:hypothetical protein